MSSNVPRRGPVALLFAALLVPSMSWAQHEHHHPVPEDTTSHRTSSPLHRHDEEHENMNGMYGPYPVSREASGTSWQPQAALHEGLHITKHSWMLMLHGFADIIYDYQDGPRGDTKFFSSNMVMATARRSLGPGIFGVRMMLSLEPGTIGKEGYPLLLQTGETANGTTPLIDRQHPHDLFMELAGTYSVSSGTRSIFIYGGLPGEPALGPPAFMHRFSGSTLRRLRLRITGWIRRTLRTVFSPAARSWMRSKLRRRRFAVASRTRIVGTSRNPSSIRIHSGCP